jgi:hypothetical protein
MKEESSLSAAETISGILLKMIPLIKRYVFVFWQLLSFDPS